MTDAGRATNGIHPGDLDLKTAAGGSAQPYLQIFPVSIGFYENHESLDVESEVGRVVRILDQFGGVEVAWDVEMRVRDGAAVDERLMAWSSPPQPADSILYWVGHGWSNGTQVALVHSRSPVEVSVYGISPEKLAEPIRRRQSLGDKWAIVVVDTCWSKDFADRVAADLDVESLLLVGVSGDGPTTLGRFSSVLEACVRDNFRTANEIELWQLVGELDRRLPEGRVTGRRLGHSILSRRNPPLAGAITVSLDVLRELEDALDRLSEDERHHFLVKAQGVDEGEISWFFEGRNHERAVIAEWLRHAESGLLVVTGSAGVGKSAVLGDTLVRSLPELSVALEKAGLIDELPPAEIPPRGVFDEVIHLTGITVDDLVRRIASGAHLGPPPPETTTGTAYATAKHIDWVVQQLRSRNETFTLLVDALDEATDPLAVARSVLRPLSSVSGVRVVVGTRPSTKDSPDHPAGTDQDLLDGLGATPESQSAQTLWIVNDQEAAARYVTRRLLRAKAGGLLTSDGQQALDKAITAAARAIGDQQREFLFARLAVYEILADPSLLADSRSLSLSRLLSAHHRDIFAVSVGRLTRLSDCFLPLLEALALARGRGLPIIGGVWALAATALADASGGIVIQDNDISSLLAVAQPYIAIDVDAGQTVYRLAHRTFVEYFVGQWAA